jgi:hypothetical protein
MGCCFSDCCSLEDCFEEELVKEKSYKRRKNNITYHFFSNTDPYHNP